MHVRDALAARRSVRDFLPTPVPRALIQTALQEAARAPSGGNLQPWHMDVVAGERLQALVEMMQTRLRAGTTADAGGQVEAPEYDIYPKTLASPYKDRRFQIGEDMYARLGIPREDRAARRAWFARNYAFFGAPLAMFCSVDRSMGQPQWSDLGMYLQSLMLLLQAQGLASCAQESWAVYPHTVGGFLQLPPQRMLFCGLAVGYANPEHPVNDLVSARAPLEEFVRWHGL